LQKKAIHVLENSPFRHITIWKERAARGTRQKGGAAHEKEKQQQHRLKRYREQHRATSEFYGLFIFFTYVVYSFDHV